MFWVIIFQLSGASCILRNIYDTYREPKYRPQQNTFSVGYTRHKLNIGPSSVIGPAFLRNQIHYSDYKDPYDAQHTIRYKYAIKKKVPDIPRYTRTSDHHKLQHYSRFSDLDNTVDLEIDQITPKNKKYVYDKIPNFFQKIGLGSDRKFYKSSIPFSVQSEFKNYLIEKQREHQNQHQSSVPYSVLSELEYNFKEKQHEIKSSVPYSVPAEFEYNFTKKHHEQKSSVPYSAPSEFEYNLKEKQRELLQSIIKQYEITHTSTKDQPSTNTEKSTKLNATLNTTIVNTTETTQKAESVTTSKPTLFTTVQNNEITSTSIPKTVYIDLLKEHQEHHYGHNGHMPQYSSIPDYHMGGVYNPFFHPEVTHSLPRYYPYVGLDPIDKAMASYNQQYMYQPMFH